MTINKRSRILSQETIMKVVAINGSPRSGGNTEALLKKFLNHWKPQVGAPSTLKLVASR